MKERITGRQLAQKRTAADTVETARPGGRVRLERRQAAVWGEDVFLLVIPAELRAVCVNCAHVAPAGETPRFCPRCEGVMEGQTLAVLDRGTLVTGDGLLDLLDAYDTGEEDVLL